MLLVLRPAGAIQKLAAFYGIRVQRADAETRPQKGLGVFCSHYGVFPCWVSSVAFLVFFVAWCFTLPRLWCILLPPRCFMLLEWVFSVATLVFFCCLVFFVACQDS